MINMKFQRGVKGFVLVIVSLMITTVLGYALAAEETINTVTDYDPYANISGLYDYDRTDKYVPYDPAANLTGYHAENSEDSMSGVSFTATDGKANMYPVIQNPEITTGSESSISGLGLTQNTPPTGANAYYRWGIVWDDDSVTIMNVQTHPGTKATLRPGVTDLDNLLSHYPVYQTADIIEWTFPTGIILNKDSWQEQREVTGSLLSYYYTIHCSQSDIVKSLEYNKKLESITATFSDGSKKTIGDPKLIDLCYLGASEDAVISNLQVLGDSGSFKTYTYPDPIYYDPLHGVKLTAPTVIWENGYRNAALSITFNNSVSGDYQVLEYSLELKNGYHLNITVSFSRNGGVTIDLTDSGNTSVGYAFYRLSAWKTGIINLDLENAIFTVTPCNSFRDFSSYKEYPNLEIEEGSLDFLEDVKGQDFSKIIIDNENGDEYSNLEFQIGDTRAFLNTYGSVMNDPSISISEYYPELTEYRLDYRSFALYGDSVTINGVTYPVTNGTISVIVNDVPEIHELQNIAIYHTGGNTKLEFINDDVTYDLGATTDDTVSFIGTWYFENDLYKQVQKDVKTYDLDFRTFGFDSGAFVMMFLGLLAVSSAIVARKSGLSAVDLGVIVISGIVGLTIVGLV